MKQHHRRHTGQHEPQAITKAVAHIRLEAPNVGKLAALDDLAQVYLAFCQQYVTLFCTDEPPNKFRATCFATPLSERGPRVAIQQAAYHKAQITDPKTGKVKHLNTSVQLNKREDGVWWLTLSYDESVTVHTAPAAPVIGVDVGIANFLTTSDGKHYGTFHGKLRERHKRDREKRRRKAKLRTCLEKKGIEKLPSTSSRSGQRLIRHVRQEINRAVNQLPSIPMPKSPTNTSLLLR